MHGDNHRHTDPEGLKVLSGLGYYRRKIYATGGIMFARQLATEYTHNGEAQSSQIHFAYSRQVGQ